MTPSNPPRRTPPRNVLNGYTPGRTRLTQIALHWRPYDHPGMRRTSPQAHQVASHLAACGYLVDTRRLERWCGDGLGPLDLEPADRALAHFEQVAELATSGRTTDMVALRLAAHGYPTRRLRSVLLRRLDITPTPPPFSPVIADLSTVRSPEEDGDAAFATIERDAWLLERADVPLLRVIRAAFVSNAADLASTRCEAPAEVVHSFFVSVGCLVAGDDLYNQEVWSALLRTPPLDDPDEFERFMAGIRPDPRDREDAYRLTPLSRIAAIAQWLATHVPQGLARIGVTDVSMADVEEWCCLGAPYAAYLIRQAAPHLAAAGIAETELAQPFRDYLDWYRSQPTSPIVDAPFVATDLQAG